jgi:Protein of unknown function (DUF3048) N-terminal domain/Protein of unknown function (DUF3048) C-terminal domain
MSSCRRRAVGLAVSAAALAGCLGACGSGHRKGTASPTTTRVAQPAKCALTGVTPLDGRVPDRPALAVKVDNLAVARPPYGLSAADVVYEEPVEGGITRFIVIFQCRDAPRIEPIRSGRIIDPAIVSQFGAHPLFAYAGGIDAAVAAIRSSSLVDVGVERAPKAYSRDSTRSAPHNLVSSTAALYTAGAAKHPSSPPPAPVFSYGPLPKDVHPAASVHVPYEYSNVMWTWEPGRRVWLRSYADTGTATMGEGGQITATNVIVMKVVIYPSPYVEDASGTHENLLVLTGTGSAQVFRDGAVINGRWDRSGGSQNTQYLDSSGRPIALAPGTTWVELVPTTVAVTVTP